MKSASGTSRPLGVEFGLAASSAVGAVIFTNPLDVVKVRLQLQGELLKRGTYHKLYKNTLHAGYVILKNEGIRGLQSGLTPAFGFQIALNGIRIGSYKFSRTYGFTLNNEGQTDFLRTALVSGIAGCCGAVVGSPFYLVKIRMQSQAAKAIAVGHQHGYGSTSEAFRSLWREGGISGLYQRWYANVPRVFFGSSTQLTMFSLATDLLRPIQFFENHPMILTFFSALIGGSSLALMTQPLDVISVRLYNQATDNQGKALIYRNYFDALIKIFKTEGIFGLYKGLFPTWMRSAPHTVLCLCFYEQLERLYDGFTDR
ncbi:solute carrier family 25 member 35-like [Fopius arisanus]|uniref:Solute carrier family 25 member 35-like n=1 Tax=Fopius arisanus TaxID=64838 RepID=A0A9R1TY89_9HYME|nr:PREDICTED: solute carrier family 25 member 35-like [Fopius arisanus]